MTRKRDARANRLLAALPAADRARLSPHLEPEQVELKQLLYEPGKHIDCVYFPRTAVVSVLTTMDDGSGVEIATIGNEGMVGVPLFLGTTFMPVREFSQAQVPGEVIRMDADTFQEETAAGGALHHIVQRYVQAFFSQVSQQVACNGLHSIEERCSRWLLLTHDRVGSDEFPLTQEFLSQMLGVRRASVTVAAGMLQSAGFIRYRRGRMTVIDREGLEGSSCECYGIIRGEFDRLLG
ncbi:MAG TPA: Crp/Fnr family transcriptional regulator [Acidimicrobiales bacterium]|nr:Crp/Fnr family transcriptional regulator [Acidimicrobiales bacterium]